MDLAFVLPTHGATVTVTAPTTAATAFAAAPSATASAQQGVAALGVAAVAGAAMRRGRRSAKVPQAGSRNSLKDSFLGGAFKYVVFLFIFIFEEIIPFFFEADFYKWVETTIWILIQSWDASKESKKDSPESLIKADYYDVWVMLWTQEI